MTADEKARPADQGPLTAKLRVRPTPLLRDSAPCDIACRGLSAVRCSYGHHRSECQGVLVACEPDGIRGGELHRTWASCKVVSFCVKTAVTQGLSALPLPAEGSARGGSPAGCATAGVRGLRQRRPQREAEEVRAVRAGVLLLGGLPAPPLEARVPQAGLLQGIGHPGDCPGISWLPDEGWPPLCWVSWHWIMAMMDIC